MAIDLAGYLLKIKVFVVDRIQIAIVKVNYKEPNSCRFFRKIIIKNGFLPAGPLDCIAFDCVHRIGLSSVVHVYLGLTKCL